MLRLVFQREIAQASDYRSPDAFRVESDFVASLVRLNSDLQYCITSITNQRQLNVDPLWKEYLSVWCDALSGDIAKWLAAANDGQEWPECINDIEAQVDKRIDIFLRAMFRDNVVYHSIRYRLSA